MKREVESGINSAVKQLDLQGGDSSGWFQAHIPLLSAGSRASVKSTLLASMESIRSTLYRELASNRDDQLAAVRTIRKITDVAFASSAAAVQLRNKLVTFCDGSAKWLEGKIEEYTERLSGFSNVRGRHQSPDQQQAIARFEAGIINYTHYLGLFEAEQEKLE